MKEIVSLWREIRCENCGGSALLEFDRVEISFADGAKVKLSGVPLYQCRECDHRQAEADSRAFMEQLASDLVDRHLGPGEEREVQLTWREVHALTLDIGEGGSGSVSRVPRQRLFELEWDE